MTKKHTPTPWNINGKFIEDYEGEVIAVTIVSHRDLSVDSANAAHIVKCVNMHDELIAALKEISELTRATLMVDTAGSAVNRCNLAIDIAVFALKKVGEL